MTSDNTLGFFFIKNPDRFFFFIQSKLTLTLTRIHQTHTNRFLLYNKLSASQVVPLKEQFTQENKNLYVLYKQDSVESGSISL